MKKIISLMFLLISFMTYSENIKVTLVQPEVLGVNPFWDKTSKYMEIAAKKLNIDLKIIYPALGHRIEVKKVSIEELNSSTKPNYLIYNYNSQTTKDILELAEQKKVYSFIFNSDIPENEKSIVGNVNEKYKYWIGHMFPNDFDAGYKLGKSLIDEARKKNLKGKDGKIHIAGLSGSYDSTVATDRNKGLEKAVAETDDVILHQILFVLWEYQNSYDKTILLFNRYPEINIIWAASDLMALGASEASKSLGKTPGKDILLGGIDWSEEGINGIKNNQLVSSVGGHFLEGVTTLLLIKDHSQGINILEENFPVKTNMEIIDKTNINNYEEALKYDKFLNLDLNSMLKSNNKTLKKFNFDLLKNITYSDL